jgi:LysR family transcriptional regulator, carnitine catabolism transcriptional activator
MNIKYRQLKGFALAAQLGSFKAAADALSITQPSFSVLMKELEDDLGVALFERTARKCELTQAGRLFERDIPDLLEQLEQAYRRMADFAQGRIGSLSIATLGSLSVGVIAKTLGEFQKRFPRVPVTLHELRNDLVFDAVEKGKVELGLAAMLTPPDALQFESLFTDRLVLLAPKGHPVEGKSVRWRSLTQYPCILMSTGPAEFALRANDVKINPAFVVENLSTAVAMVRHGMGVTVLPSCVIASLNVAGLRCIPFEGNHSTRNLGVAYRNKAWLSPAAANFVQMLRETQPPKDAGWQRSGGRV